MNLDDRSPAAPPRDAYSRVTDAGRFWPLHALALDLLARLGAEYEVSQFAAFQLLPDMHLFEHARPPVMLTPLTPEAAPLAVAFTMFPSLVVRCGRWFVESFPSCGCDACRETSEGEGARFQTLVRDVVDGRFSEALRIPLFGDARLSWSLGDVTALPGHYGRGFRALSRASARALRGDGPRTVTWRPWLVRGPLAAPVVEPVRAE